MLAAQGYPEHPIAGALITVPANLGDSVIVFHAGTSRNAAGQLIASGGRVLSVTGLGPTIADARRHSLRAAERIEFAGKQFRTDIGWRELERDARAS